MAALILKFELDTGAAYEVEVDDIGKGTGEVYMRHEDVLLDLKDWKFKDLWGNEFEVMYAPDWRCRVNAFLKVWRQVTIATVEKGRLQPA